MKTLILGAFGILASCVLVAQDPIKPHFLNSGEVVKAGIALYDEGEYVAAITEFNKVHPNDTNFTWACYEKSLALVAVEKNQEAINLAEMNLKAGYLEPLQFNVVGTAYDNLSQTDKALEAYDRGLKIYPFNSGLLFNRAVVFEVAKKYAEAFEAQKENLRLNPFNTSVHIRLGNLAAKQGLYTQALMSYITFLIIDPDGARSLNVLNTADQVSSMSWKELGTIDKVFPSEFSDIDFIFSNRIALNDKYKTPSPYEYPVVKQLHAIFEKINETKDLGDGFWASYYGPFYKDIAKTIKYEDLILLLVASVDDEKVAKPLAKKLVEVKALRDKLIDKWYLLHSTVKVNRDGKEWLATVSIGDDNLSVNGLVSRDALKKKNGYQEAYNLSGSLSAQGNMVSDLKQGLWKYYYETGEKLSEIGYKDDKRDGPYKVWFKNGVLKEEGQMLNDELEGEWRVYYPSGKLHILEPHKNGKEDGLGKRYFATGPVEFEYTMKEGALEGKLLEYYSTGQVYSELNYENGKKNGPGKKFYVDGQISLSQSFVNDLNEGPYKYFHNNGKLESEGMTANDKAVGTWKYYYPNGKIKLERNFDEEAKDNGPAISFTEDGKVYKSLDYSKGDLKSVLYQDNVGNALFQAKVSKQAGLFEEYDEFGVKVAEGNLINAKREQTWKNYNSYGVLTQEVPYSDGKEQGSVINYFSNGKTESITNFKDGEWDGLYVDYFLNGNVSSTGNYVAGKKWQEWLTFNNNGTLASRNWYESNVSKGIQEYYDCFGKLNSREYFNREGILISIVSFDSTGTLLDSAYMPNGNGKVSLKSYGQVPFYEANYVAGEKDGIFRWYYPNGKIESEGLYESGKKVQLWTWYHPNGQIMERGAFMYGDKVNKWEEFDYFGTKRSEFFYVMGKRDGPGTYYYEDGSKEQEQEYVNGELHGKCRYYSPDGQVKLARNYLHGKLVGYSTPDPSGKLGAMIPIKNGTAEVNSKYANGQPSVSYSYLNGVLEGEFTHYFPDGKPQIKRNCINGQDFGKSVKYYPNGQELEVTENLNDRLNGNYRSYWENGKLKMEGYYYLDNKNGEFKYFDNTGKCLGTYLYFDDTLVKVLN